MQFVIRAYDGENTLEKRKAVRPQHLENLSNFQGKNLCSGALLDDEGTMKGSILIMEVESRAGAPGNFSNVKRGILTTT